MTTLAMISIARHVVFFVPVKCLRWGENGKDDGDKNEHVLFADPKTSGQDSSHPGSLPQAVLVRCCSRLFHSHCTQQHIEIDDEIRFVVGSYHRCG